MCMSAYGLAKYRNSDFSTENLIVLSCILTSVIIHAIKDNLISNPDLLKKKTFFFFKIYVKRCQNFVHI